MASALVAGRNEPCWRERNACMKKYPKSKTNPNSGRAGFDSSDLIHLRQVDESVGLDAVASSDSLSFNRKSTSLSRRETSTTTDPIVVAGGSYVTYNIAAYSRLELRSLKNRLVSELDLVRTFSRRIEHEFQSRSGYSTSNGAAGNGVREVTSSKHGSHRPSGVGVGPQKGKISTHRDPEFTAAKNKMPPPAKVSGRKRPLPPLSSTVSRDPKRPVLQEHPPAASVSGITKRCKHILEKLMNHKPHWVFNSPVDVVALGLHDYHQIIKNPMDLGTVSSKLKKNLYRSPSDFAADVRLTFNNAMVYNPKGHEVHSLAERLLDRFEEMFAPFGCNSQALNPPLAASPELVKRPEPPPTPIRHPSPHLPGRILSPAHQSAITRMATGKQPKPKAKDLNKREMSYEEKQKLSFNLQSLPQGKMDQVVQIIRRRNPNLSQNGDEIEVDIESVDTETLWELDRFVCNVKKAMSKMRRQVLSQNQSPVTDAPPPTIDGKKNAECEMPEASSSSKRILKRMEVGEEDVDIGEEMPSTDFPPVEIEKDAPANSSSSSSGSDSSSSSNSDSASSSGSDSDDSDEAQSPFPVMKSA